VYDLYFLLFSIGFFLATIGLVRLFDHLRNKQ
jgi:hypothetical protein